MNKFKKEFEESNTSVLNGHPVFLKLYQQYIDLGLNHWMQLSDTLGDNRKFLTEKLGKQTFCTSDSACRRLHVWKVALTSGTLWILTARERGTTYEFTGGDAVATEAIEYIKELFNITE